MKMFTGQMRRKLALMVAGLLALVVALAACGSDSDDKDSGSQASGTSNSFPVTVESANGPVTVEEKPVRVVALGAQMTDALLSIGVQPVAVALSQEAVDTSYPWLAGKIEGELDGGLLTAEGAPILEKLATYDPDLVVGLDYQLSDKGLTDQINQIAPTFAVPYSADVSWSDIVTMFGQLTGENEKATTAIADTEATFEKARGTIPALQGKTADFVYYGASGFGYGATGWIELYGLAVPPAGKTGTSVSVENMDQLNSDVLAIWPSPADQRAVLEADPRFARLPASEGSAVIWLDDALANATNGPGPLSLAYTDEKLGPQLIEINNSQ